MITAVCVPAAVAGVKDSLRNVPIHFSVQRKGNNGRIKGEKTASIYF